MIGMIGNNPMAMGTMGPGAMGMMRGMGLLGGMGGGMQQSIQPQGPINPMQPSSEAGMMGAAPAEPDNGGSFFDPSSIASMAAQLRGVKNEGAQMQQQLEQSPGTFAGPMPDGGNLYDAIMQRAKMMQDNPLIGGFAQKFRPI